MGHSQRLAVPRQDPQLNYFKLIESTLDNLGEHFKPHELAYLALTGKIESVIRDRLAYLLHIGGVFKPSVVNREWKKIDIAIVPKRHGGGLGVGIQLKAKSSTYIVVSEARSLRRAALEDLRKCRGKVSKAYFLLIAPHFVGSPGRIFREIFKYRWEQVPESKVRNAVTGAFKGWHIVGSHNGKPLNAGKAFDMEVSLHYWLCKRE